MSDALPVIVVPDPDDTTRRVLSALRAAAIHERPNGAENGGENWLLRWDSPRTLHISPSEPSAEGSDARLGFVEGVLTSPKELQANAAEEHAQQKESVVAPLLAFADAIARATGIEEVNRAAIVAAERVLEADGVILLGYDEDRALAMQAASRRYLDAGHPFDQRLWDEAHVPTVSVSVSNLEEEGLGTQLDLLRPILVPSRDRAVLVLPLGVAQKPAGALVAVFDDPQPFDFSTRQQAALLAHQIAAGWAIHKAAPSASNPSEEVAESATEDARAETATVVPEDPALPFKTLIGLATVAAYGLERTPTGSLEVIWATKSYRKLIGNDGGDALDFERILASVHPTDRGGVRAAFEEVEWETPTRFDHRLGTTQGDARWVRQAVLRREQDGREELLCVLLDIDGDKATLRRAEEALAEARQRTTGSLLAPLSATFRGPLTAVLDEVSTLALPGPIDEQVRREAAQHIVEKGRGMMSALNVLVDLVQLESGDVDLVRTDLLLNESVEKVLSVLGPLALRKGLEVDWYPGSSLYTLHQDAQALSRVLHHLVGTAITSTEAGTIAIAIDQATNDGEERFARLTVRVDEANDASPSPKAEFTSESVLATPLSSIIAERLVGLMGGQLHRSSVVGEGVSLSLWLPFVERGVEERTSNPAAKALSAPRREEPSRSTDPSESVDSRSSDEELRSTPVRQYASLEAAANAFSFDGTDAFETVLPDLGFASAEPEEVGATSHHGSSDENMSDHSLPEREDPHPSNTSESQDTEEAELDVLVADQAEEPVASTSLPEGGDLEERDAAEIEFPAAQPYARTEIALPSRGIPAFGLRPQRKAAEPSSRSLEGSMSPPKEREVPRMQLDTALDAFAGIDAEHEEIDTVPPASASEKPAASERGSVLIVEDNRETRILLEQLIGRDFDVVSVDSPRTALDALTRQQFDALVLDINLGGRETGVDVLRIARTLEGYANTFAMAVTAYGEDVDRDRFLGAGFQAYVQKPFEPDVLLTPLRAAFARQAHSNVSD